MSRREERAIELYVIATAQPDGFTNQEVMSVMDWSLKEFNDAVRDVRDTLGDDDSINLVCQPDGYLMPWRYRLVGTLEGSQPWATNRLLDAERRFMTIENVTAPIVRATDGRTIQGRKARMLNSTARFVKEQLQLLGLGEDGAA